MKIDFTGFHHNTYYPGYAFPGYNNLAETVKYLSEGQFAVSTVKRDVFKKSVLLARVVGASEVLFPTLYWQKPFCCRTY